jgi:hypothetical protein
MAQLVSVMRGTPCTAIPITSSTTAPMPMLTTVTAMGSSSPLRFTCRPRSDDKALARTPASATMMPITSRPGRDSGVEVNE